MMELEERKPVVSISKNKILSRGARRSKGYFNLKLPRMISSVFIITSCIISVTVQISSLLQVSAHPKLLCGKRILSATILPHGQRSKWADLSEGLLVSCLV